MTEEEIVLKRLKELEKLGTKIDGYIILKPIYSSMGDKLEVGQLLLYFNDGFYHYEGDSQCYYGDVAVKKLVKNNLLQKVVLNEIKQKQYRLLKDLPLVKAGEIFKEFHYSDNHVMWNNIDDTYSFSAEEIEKSSEWFEEYIENKVESVSQNTIYLCNKKQMWFTKFSNNLFRLHSEQDKAHFMLTIKEIEELRDMLNRFLTDLVNK